MRVFGKKFYFLNKNIMSYPYKRKELNKEIERLVKKGIKGSFEKQQAIFNQDEKSKNIYNDALKLANF